MMLAGHFAAHMPHPLHFFLSMIAQVPSGMEMALNLQAVRQQPQDTHKFLSTDAFFIRSSSVLSDFDDCSIQERDGDFSDFCHLVGRM